MARTAYFHKEYNFHGKSVEEVALIFRQVDLMVNAINERTGKNIDAEEMYLMVISIMNDHEVDMNSIDIAALYDTTEKLLFNYMPLIYCDATSRVLTDLKEKENKSLNILSNTGFIKGSTLRTVLKDIGIGHLFDFQIYSDEIGMSKPNKELFQHLLTSVSHHNDQISSNEIIHVGDNPVADIKGAASVGINSLLINSDQKTILTLLN